jgi:hypothetical protein
MTTSHIDESIEEVVWFWLTLTNYDDNIFENFLLLVIGEPENIEVKIMKAASEIDL